eukprot:Tbor_TRINITY_DN7549_c0_g1::TRINITY_DN7549_c0_g1_i1::g.952::m.952
MIPRQASLLDSREKVEALLHGIKYVLFDIDGVILSGDKVIDKVPQVLEYLVGESKKLYFLTNNSSHSRKHIASMFSKRGIQGVSEEMIYTSGYAASLHLKSLGTTSLNGEKFFNKNVFVIGSHALHNEIRTNALSPGVTTYGYEMHGLHPIYHSIRTAAAREELVAGEAREISTFIDNCVAMHSYTPSRMAASVREAGIPIAKDSEMELSAVVSGRDIKCLDDLPIKLASLHELEIGAVVAGIDVDFNYHKLAAAGLIIQNQHRNNKPVHLIATNSDPQITNKAPNGEEWLLPGTGCLWAALRTYLGRPPDVICGKPQLDMMDIMMSNIQFNNENDIDPESCLMIGDRISTDIAFGNAAGCRTLFVLSGCETMEDVEAARKDNIAWLPNFIGQSIADLLPLE